MEIVVRGRNVEVPEHFRQRVEDKVGQLERFDGKLSRIDVELFHEKNPRQSANCQRVEITLRGKGPVVRAEACAPDFYAALDLSCGKLDNRLRRANERPRARHGRRTPPSARRGRGGAARGLSGAWGASRRGGAAGRRRVRRGRRTPPSVRVGGADAAPLDTPVAAAPAPGLLAGAPLVAALVAPLPPAPPPGCSTAPRGSPTSTSTCRGRSCGRSTTPPPR